MTTDEDAVADAVTDVGGDTIRELQRIREELATIRAWVTFFGWLTAIWLIASVGVGLALVIVLVIQ